MIVADTSGMLALFNRREPAHDAEALRPLDGGHFHVLPA